MWLELQGVAIEKLSMQAGVATSTQPDPVAADAAAPAADPVAMGVSAQGLNSLTWLGDLVLSMSQNAMCNMCLYACSLFNLSV